MRNQFIIIITFIFILSGCSKELGVFPLNEMKNENPYTGSETLKYLSNNGDTIVFQGNGRYTEEFHSDYYYDDDKYYVNEKDKCSFIDEESNYELYIELASRTISFHQASQPNIRTSYLMDMKFIDQSEPTTTDCRSYVTNVPLPIIEFNDSNFFYDSLLLNGIYYYDVVSFSDNNFLLHGGDCSERMKADSIFYSISDGIIKLTFTNNTSWSILGNK